MGAILRGPHCGRKAALKEAEDLIEASFGDTILEMIGYIYVNSGEQHLGYCEGFLGVAGVAAGVDACAHSITTKANAFGSVARRASQLYSGGAAQAHVEAESGNGSARGSDPVDPQAVMPGNTGSPEVEMTWAVNRMDIESALKAVCNKVRTHVCRINSLYHSL
jgi:hypothetical protein